MAGEVHHGYVDTSVAGIVNTLERSEALDFTQEVFYATAGLLIKRPLKTDFSFRYFWLGNNSGVIYLENSLTPGNIFRIHHNFLDSLTFCHYHFNDKFNDNHLHADLVSR